MCPDLDPVACFGKNGLDIVESVGAYPRPRSLYDLRCLHAVCTLSIGMNYSAFSREDYFARNFAILVGIGTFWRLFYLMALVQKALALPNAPAPDPDPSPVPDTDPVALFLVLLLALLGPDPGPDSSTCTLVSYSCPYSRCP